MAHRVCARPLRDTPQKRNARGKYTRVSLVQKNKVPPFRSETIVKRSKYFRVLRRERQLLKDLTKVKPCFEVFAEKKGKYPLLSKHRKGCVHSNKGDIYLNTPRNEQRNLRWLHYYVIPHLLKFLTWEPDRNLVLELARQSEAWINISRWLTGKRSPASRLWSLSNPFVPEVKITSVQKHYRASARVGILDL